MAPRTRKNPNGNDERTIKEVEKLQSQFNDIMSSELKSINGESPDRREKLSKLHKRFINLIQQDTQFVNNQKSPNQSTFDYIASALTGTTMTDTNNPKTNQSAKSQLERLFSGGDSEIASYFLSNGIDNMHIYDEIDSICAYMYQLEEAIDIIRDNVLASDQPAEGINMDIRFEGMSAEESVDYKRTIIDMFRNEGLTKKLKSQVIKKSIKYGKEYVMIVPYSDIADKLNNLRGGFGVTENTSVFESTTHGTSQDTSTDEYTLESAMVDVGNILGVDDKDKVDSSTKILYETICDNLKNICVCENSEPPNVSGFSYNTMSNMDESMLRQITKAMKESHKDTSKTTAKKGTRGYADGVIPSDSLDGIKGCYIKIVDPRQMRAIKIFDYTLGYYYCENYDYQYAGTSLTDIMSNTMNFDERTQTVDRLVDSVLGKLKYGDVLSGDKQFRNLILNCLMYTEKRNNPIRIKFVPNEYVIPFETNLDENDNGQPVLLRSLFFSRLYISLLLFNITAIVTKSTDSEFYYLRENALDPQFDNQVTDVMDQLQQCTMDPISIAQGNMLNASKAINKRYFLSIGTSGEKAFDIDVMGGQNIDVHNDFLTEIKKMAISSTGVPSVSIDMIDEIEYATLASMSNIKNLKRCNSIQEDYNPAITKLGKLVAQFTTNMPQEIIDKLYITLRPSKVVQNNISSNQVNDVVGTVDTMVKTWYHGDDSGEPTVFDKMVMDKVRKQLIPELSPSAPWDLMDKFIEEAVIQVRSDMELAKIEKSKEEESGDSM